MIHSSGERQKTDKEYAQRFLEAATINALAWSAHT